MTFYIGVDFHPHQQTLCWCDSGTGETGSLKLDHDIQKVREFYSSIKVPALVGVEASTRAAWFESIVMEAGHNEVVCFIWTEPSRWAMEYSSWEVI
jgi:hypothetical protein